MSLRLFPVALVLGGALVFGTRAADAQGAQGAQDARGAQGAQDAQGAQVALPFRFGLSAQAFALSRTSRAPARRTVDARAMPECPMPVMVPDLAKSEPMPVARIDPAPYAVRQVPVGCVNPLGPQRDTATRRRAPSP